MVWLKNRGNRLMVSLLAGLAGAVLLAGMPAVKEPGGMMAWWGTMYPKFCFAEMPEDDADEEIAGDENTNPNEMQGGQMKTKLWILEFLKG